MWISQTGVSIFVPQSWLCVAVCVYVELLQEATEHYSRVKLAKRSTDRSKHSRTRPLLVLTAVTDHLPVLLRFFVVVAMPALSEYTNNI